eukprot:4068499-Amphidinium_carterae.1
MEVGIGQVTANKRRCACRATCEFSHSWSDWNEAADAAPSLTPQPAMVAAAPQLPPSDILCLENLVAPGEVLEHDTSFRTSHGADATCHVDEDLREEVKEERTRQVILAR